MALAAIGIPEMTQLIKDMENAKTDIRGDVKSISGTLQALKLSSEFSESADFVCQWVDEVMPDLQRRLSKAQQIEKETPGIQNEVTIDESTLPTATPHEAKTAANDTANAITNYTESGDPSDIPDSILDNLKEHAGDPYFDAQLAKRIPPDQLADFIQQLGRGRTDMEPQTREGPQNRDEREVPQSEWDALEAYDEEYGDIAEYLGYSYGNSSMLTGDLAWSPDQRDAWDETFKVNGGNKDDAQALSWMMTYGHWDSDVVKTTVEHIYTYEQHVGEGVQSWSIDGQFTMPGGERMRDPLAAALVPVSRDPALAQELLDDSTFESYNYGAPSWSPRDTDPDEIKYSTKGLLEYLMLRPFPQDEGQSMVATLAAGMDPGAPSFEASQRISDRITEFEQAVQEQIEQAEADKPKDIAHAILDGAGLIPGLGELFDGINAGLYALEGDWANAGLSAASMIPFAGWGAAGVKGAKNLDHLEDVRDALKGAENAKDAAKNLENAGGATDIAPDLTHFGHPDNAFGHPDGLIGPRRPTQGPGSDITIDKPWSDEVGGFDNADDMAEWADEAGVTANSKAPFGSDEHMAADMLKKRNAQGRDFDYDAWRANYEKRYIDNKKGYVYEDQWWAANSDRFDSSNPNSNWKQDTPGSGDGGVPYDPGNSGADPGSLPSSDKRYYDAYNAQTKEAFELKSGQPKVDNRQLAKDTQLADQGWDITYVFAQEPSAATKKKLLDAGIGYEVTNTAFS